VLKLMTDSKTHDDHYAEIYGTPGLGARSAGLSRMLLPLLLICFAAGYLLAVIQPLPGLSSAVAGGFLLVLTILLVFLLKAGQGQLSAYVKGARGEERTAAELARLSGDYTVYHNLRVTDAPGHHQEIDHIVVGQGKILVVESKCWSGDISLEDGEILVNGQQPSRPPLEQVKRSSSALRRYIRLETGLECEVIPVLCFAGGSLNAHDQGAAGVRICDLEALRQVIAEPAEDPADNKDLQTVKASLLQVCRG
jgi:hypothetical protein